jgi:hypothetical protein
MAPRPTDQSSAKRRHTPTSAEAFVLAGRSELPDPRFNAFRKDLADVALAGRVIASHYAEPLSLVIGEPAVLREAPSDEAAAVRELQKGERFAMLDDSLGWAWGYAGPDRVVGYLRSSALGSERGDRGAASR